MKAHKLPELSVEEYIAHERETGVKYEYHNGKIFALAGGTLNHGLLCGNIFLELSSKLKDNNSGCKPVNSEVKLNIKSKNSFVYPDSMVICGEMEIAESDQNSITNPVLIVEVLSKSTADHDRGDKFYLYRQISTLQEFVLIEQEKPIVEVYYKPPQTDSWQISRFEGLDSNVILKSLNLKIKMSDLYYDIKLAEG